MSAGVGGAASETAAIMTLARNALNVKSTAEGAVTLAVGEFMNGLYIQSGTPGAVNKTTPTAAAIVAAFPEAVVGSQFEFILDNGGDGILTLVAGAGVTLSGTATCGIAKNKRYVGVITNVAVPAVRVMCMAQLA
jgi:hypothetical protein